MRSSELKVDVIVPTHAGREKYLEALLESFAQQDFRDFRVLIADNHAERSAPPDFIQRDWGFPIEYRINATNLGPQGNLTSLLAEATADYIKPMMSDDLLEPDALGKLVRVLDDNASVSLVFGRRRFIDQDGTATGEARFHGYEQRPSGPVSNKELLYDTISVLDWFPGEPSNVLLRNHLVSADEALTSFTSVPDKAYQGSFDLIWYLRLLTHGDAWYLNEPVSCIREHDDRGLNDSLIGMYCRIDYYYLAADARHLGLIDDAVWGKAVQIILRDITALFKDPAVDRAPQGLAILAYAANALAHLKQHRFTSTQDQICDFFDMLYEVLTTLLEDRVLGWLEAQQKSIALYGAGNFGKKILQSNKPYVPLVHTVISGNRDDAGNELCGRTVNFLLDTDLERFDYMLIASTFVEEISQALMQQGKTPFLDFLPLTYPRV
jgi:glycosyltransferase involved in cell wall biosynthesis